MNRKLLPFALVMSGIVSCAACAQENQAFDDDNPFAIRFAKEDRAGAERLEGIRKEWTFSDDGAVVGIDFQQGIEKRLLSVSDLPALASFSELRVIVLPTGRVTDEWIPHVAKLLKLRVLSMVNGKVTNRGLEPLARLQQMRKANLAGCVNLGDPAMEVVADWENLEELDLYDTSITDDGVRTIRGLTKLRILHLGTTAEGNGITNRSVDVLKTFTNLKELHIVGTSIDRFGVEALIEALPNCHIP